VVYWFVGSVTAVVVVGGVCLVLVLFGAVLWVVWVLLWICLFVFFGV